MAIRLMNPSVEMDGENQIGEFRGTVDIDPSLGRSMSPPEWTITGGVCPRAVPCPHAVEAPCSKLRGIFEVYGSEEARFPCCSFTPPHAAGNMLAMHVHEAFFSTDRGPPGNI